MNPLLANYIKVSCVFGAGFTAVHGYRRRDHRLPTLNPFYHTIGILRDGMLGTIAGPFLIPYALVADHKHCPIPRGGGTPPHPPPLRPDALDLGTDSLDGNQTS